VLQIPNKLLKIGNASGHLICETLDGNNLNANVVDMAEVISPKGWQKLAGGNAPGKAP
jgi:hypothetical protein